LLFTQAKMVSKNIGGGGNGKAGGE